MRRAVVALTALLSLAGAAVVLFYLLVLAGAGDRAARMAPADTALYVNVYLQPSTGQQMRLGTLIGRFPGFRDVDTLDAKIDQLAQRFSAAAGVDYLADLKPWLGNQLAIALAPPLTESEPVVLVAVKDRTAAGSSAPRLFRDAVRRIEHLGVTISVGASVSYAFVDEFLVVAPTEERVRTVIDTAADRLPSLADQASFAAAMRSVPADNLASGYIDLPILDDPGPALASLFGASHLGMALTAEDGGLRLIGRAEIEQDRAGLLLPAGVPPALAGWMPSDTELALTALNVDKMLTSVEAAASRPGLGELAATLAGVRAALTLGLGLDLETDLLPLLDAELGVAVTEIAADPRGQLLLRPASQETAVAGLDRLRDALEAAGMETSTRTVAGERVTLVAPPGLPRVAYAPAGGVIVAGGDERAVGEALRARSSGQTLAAAASYQEALALLGTRGAVEGYLDAGTVVRLVAELLPLSEADRDILQPIRALGFAVLEREGRIEIHGGITIR